ncbi:MAG TPA: LamG-like jellyroll fold domain-containing protein [Lutibacter sp.]
MKKYLFFKSKNFKLLIIFALLINFIGNAQSEMQVNILGGADVTSFANNTIIITSGNSLTFQITNPELKGCSTTLVQSVTSSNANFVISPTSVSGNIKPADCKIGDKYLNFTVTRDDSVCSTENSIITVTSNKEVIKFTLRIDRAPIISVLGGRPYPSANIIDGTTTTKASDGTYFGVVENGASVTRRFHILNTGSCPLDVSSISLSIESPVLVNNFTLATQANLPQYINPGDTFWIDITFTAANPEDDRATISIASNAVSPSDIFTFNVQANVFKTDILGPGGVTADFRLWLKATRGVIKDVSNKVSEWRDLGVNGKSAFAVSGSEPTYIDDVASNINFNPVIEFKNNGDSLNQYLKNSENGFYNQDIFIVMEPDVNVSSSSKMTIFSGTVSTFTSVNGIISGKAQYDNDGDGVRNDVDDSDSNLSDDLTAVGLGNFRSTGGLWYNQGSSTTNPYYNLTASSNRSYNKAGIINAHNVSGEPADGMHILYNSINDAKLPTKKPTSLVFDNVGYIQIATPKNIVWGTPYKIGKNAHDTHGNLNGRVAEIMTFAERVSDIDRPKIETYLAIKHGITLGETKAEKNYVNSAGTIIWNITDNNAGFNYNVAGIGRDDSSDLNQKQSKSVNDANEVIIGLGGLYTKNSDNINGFSANLEFLVWGCDGGSFTGAQTNTVTITAGITTSLTRIDRKWKIVETGGDVGNVYVGIPATAFSGFSKNANEEYVLIVSDNANFANGDIIDVIPLKIDKDIYGNPIYDKEGSKVYTTWYDFDAPKLSPKYFTFGKALKLSPTIEGGIERDTEKRSVNIAAGDYLVGETMLAINYDALTVSAWVKSTPNVTTIRTIMAKGSKMQMRLNSAHQVEVMLDNDTDARSTSSMVINDGKWHHITFAYNSGTIFLYIDGILDHSIQNVKPPSANFEHFSVGALFVNKNSIINPFLGEIDELFIWNRVLTQEQVRYLMNQEAKRFGAGAIDQVNGKVLSQTITKDEVIAIPWSDLKVYFDFNSFYGSTVEGLTDDRDFLRINYLRPDKDKQIVETQTAPLPYTTKDGGTGNWDDPETWTYGNSVWHIPNIVGLDSKTTIDWNIVETNHNITSDRNITVLGLKNNSKKITIEGKNAVEAVPGTGQSLRITHYLKLDGVIDLEGESQLLQDTGSDLFGTGTIEKDQQGTANSFNYNYWSSPVSSNPNGTFTIKGVLNDGTDASIPNKNGIISFHTPYTWADNAYSGAIRISSYWLHTFNGTNNTYSKWNRINESTSLIAGEGYSMKGTSGKVSILDLQNYVYRGKPNNGEIKLEISAGNDRLIGNPYPSAIDANEFILDNLSAGHPSGDNIFNGALYFWDHFGQMNSHILKAYVGGYATYTLMGGTQAIADDTRINTTSRLKASKVPERYIPVGQGFFVITSLDKKLEGKTTTTVEGGTILFKNSQRYFKREESTLNTPGIENTGSVFMKNSSSKTAQSVGGKEIKETYEEVDLRQKIRLLYHSPNGYNRQLLIGVDENTTNNFDIGYDGPIADTGSEDMFWMIQDVKFVIQGVPVFDENQEFPLGVKIAKAGLATIKIDGLDNIDENLSLHIKDKLTGETHNISQKSFKINLEAGEYLDRFSLTFKMQKLVEEDVAVAITKETQLVTAGIQVFMNNTIGELQIKNNSTEELLKVNLINSLGQIIKTWNTNLNIRTISLPVNTATGVYIVQINTKTGKINKKISVE